MKGSLRQRSTGSWELTIDMGRDLLGQRRRKFVTVRGNKAQAQRKLRELLSNVDQGIAIPNGKLSLGDWLERWLVEVVATGRRQNTKERYEGVVRRHITPCLGHVDLSKLTPSHIQALESHLSAKGMLPTGSA